MKIAIAVPQKRNSSLLRGIAIDHAFEVKASVNEATDHRFALGPVNFSGAFAPFALASHGT
jgi:hypothetical protein